MLAAAGAAHSRLAALGGVSEVQTVVCTGTAGTFTLSYGGETTGKIREEMVVWSSILTDLQYRNKICAPNFRRIDEHFVQCPLQNIL